MEIPKQNIRSSYGAVIYMFFIIGVVVVYSSISNGGLNDVITDSPVPTPSNTIIYTSRGVPMREIPAGEFTMGRYVPKGKRDESPPHQVSLKKFYMDVYEVNIKRYQSCVNAGACTPPSLSYKSDSTNYYLHPAYVNYPVADITWFQADTYCKWRNARLPTEAEWEKAARGGLSDKKYPWGNNSPTCEPGHQNSANLYGELCKKHILHVGSFSSNAYGLYDMAGNVNEWVSSWYEPYPTNMDSYNTEYGKKNRVIRGGSYQAYPHEYLVTKRDFLPPGDHLDTVGFRCALTP